MTKQFKVGDKVRILNVRGISGANEYFKNGDTTHVLKIASDDTVYLYCNDGDYEDGLFILDSEHIHVELVEESSSNSERITALETQVAELQAELQALKKRKKPKHLLAHYPTPNEQRKAVIERAKAFVTEHTENALSGTVQNGGNYAYQQQCNVITFYVNAKKRVVTALGHAKYGGELRLKTFAKCAPDDVFNADIGKAIALGRALGLDVSEFENAPKPTEVVVGHITEILHYGTRDKAGEVCVVVGINSEGNPKYADGMFATDYAIADDTEAQYV